MGWLNFLAVFVCAWMSMMATDAGKYGLAVYTALGSVYFIAVSVTDCIADAIKYAADRAMEEDDDVAA